MLDLLKGWARRPAPPGEADGPAQPPSTETTAPAHAPAYAHGLGAAVRAAADHKLPEALRALFHLPATGRRRVPSLRVARDLVAWMQMTALEAGPGARSRYSGWFCCDEIVGWWHWYCDLNDIELVDDAVILAQIQTVPGVRYLRGKRIRGEEFAALRARLEARGKMLIKPSVFWIPPAEVRSESEVPAEAVRQLRCRPGAARPARRTRSAPPPPPVPDDVDDISVGVEIPMRRAA